VKSPSLSVSRISRSAPIIWVTSVARWSFAPPPPPSRRISSVATVSFSLTIGTIPRESSVRSVFLAFTYRSRTSKSSWVRSSCATWRPRFSNARS
jgi:hypothetical protein